MGLSTVHHLACSRAGLGTLRYVMVVHGDPLYKGGSATANLAPDFSGQYFRAFVYFIVSI